MTREKPRLPSVDVAAAAPARAAPKPAPSAPKPAPAAAPKRYVKGDGMTTEKTKVPSDGEAPSYYSAADGPTFKVGPSGDYVPADGPVRVSLRKRQALTPIKDKGGIRG